MDKLEELINHLPSHLHISRNEYAREDDRYRLYSTATEEYIEKFNGATVEEVMLKYIAWEEKSSREWNNT